jgi:isopentenyl diphosphate isomerase/L-lactate dehydrogenase-like FMN-dependent dehydrogenase
MTLSRADADEQRDEPFAAFQTAIESGAAEGYGPWLPVSSAELEAAAERILSPRARAYLFGGAGRGDTMRANREAFRRWQLIPRAPLDVGARDHRSVLFGTELAAPLLVAPIGTQTRYHREGELATARAAAATGVTLIASGAGDHTLEQSAEANGDSSRWFQLYWPRDDEITKSLVARAERAGYRAIVLTVDALLAGWRPDNLRHGQALVSRGRGIANFLSDPEFRSRLERPPEDDPDAAVRHYFGIAESPAITWERLDWLRELTDLPIVVKGLQHPDDAVEAVRRGIDGIVVSNHGGRQVDGAVGSLDVLPDIVDAVGDALPVLFDSGIRGGADIVKALALGAVAVLVGRPYIWGLALAGQEGVEWVLRGLLAEMDITTALVGETSAPALTRAAVRRDGA